MHWIWGVFALLNELKNCPKDNIYMDNRTFFALTPDHKKYLKAAKLWDFIIRSRAAVKADK